MEKGAMDKLVKEDKSGDAAPEGSGAAAGGKDQDVVFIQDVGFTVKIIAPGVEPFDIQVIFFQTTR